MACVGGGGDGGKGEGGGGLHSHDSLIVEFFFLLLQTGAGVASAVGLCRLCSAGSRQSHRVGRRRESGATCLPVCERRPVFSGVLGSRRRRAGEDAVDEEVRGDI